MTDTIKLFFDLDGPILDVSERYFEVYCECLKKTSFIPLSKDNYWNKKRQKISEVEILAVAPKTELTNIYTINRKKLIEDPVFLEYDKVWTALLPTYERLFHEIPSVLVTLRNKPEHLHQQLRNLTINSWFCRVLSNPAIERSEDRWKIKVALIKESGLLHDISPRDCLFVGDTETDILAGKNLGMKTAAIGFGIRTDDILLKYNPDLLFTTQLEFSKFLKEQYL